jgi:hypothetical protein
MPTAKSKSKPAATPAQPVHAPPVMAQPQSKHEAAQAVGMTLATNDAWAQAYFNTNDLHYEERILFG